LKAHRPFKGSREIGTERTTEVRVVATVMRDQADYGIDGAGNKPERGEFMRDAASPTNIFHHRHQLNRCSLGLLLGTLMRSNRARDGAQTSIT
jgi:hypothetical protein